MKRILLTFLTVTLMVIGFHIDVSAVNLKKHRVKITAKHQTVKNLIKTSVSNTVNPKDIMVVHEYNFTKSIAKNYNKQNGVNCSFFDPKTLKVFGVLITDKDKKVNTIYNRPTIIITKNNEVNVVEGNLTSLDNIKYAVGAGGYLTIDGKVNVSSNTHFTPDFYKLQVNRTVIAITNDNKLKFMTYKNRSLYSVANSLVKDKSIKVSLFMDGGSSTQGSKYSSGRRVPVHIIW